MDIELFLDCEEVEEGKRADVEKRFHDWYREGADIRPNKMSFGSMSKLDKPDHYFIDLGYADTLLALRDLHSRIHRLGAKVFVHFIY